MLLREELLNNSRIEAKLDKHESHFLFSFALAFAFSVFVGKYPFEMIVWHNVAQSYYIRRIVQAICRYSHTHSHTNHLKTACKERFSRSRQNAMNIDYRQKCSDFHHEKSQSKLQLLKTNWFSVCAVDGSGVPFAVCTESLINFFSSSKEPRSNGTLCC